MYFISICLICDRINRMRYSKHKLSTIYMLYTVKKLSNYSLPPYVRKVAVVVRFTVSDITKIAQFSYYSLL